MSETKDAVVKRGTPREKRDVENDLEWLNARISQLETKLEVIKEREGNIKEELTARKQQVAELS